MKVKVVVKYKNVEPQEYVISAGSGDYTFKWLGKPNPFESLLILSLLEILLMLEAFSFEKHLRQHNDLLKGHHDNHFEGYVKICLSEETIITKTILHFQIYH